MHAYLVQCAKIRSTGLPFLQMKTLNHWIVQQYKMDGQFYHVPSSPVYGRRLRD